MVTEMAQYSALPCVFGIWQNSEKLLISNGLRFVVTCLLMVALWVLFHVARHTWATTAFHTRVAVGVISNALGHSSVKVTETYLKPFENEMLDRTNKKIIAYVKKCSIRQG